MPRRAVWQHTSRCVGIGGRPCDAAKAHACDGGLGCERSSHTGVVEKLQALGAGPEAVAQLKRAPDGKAEALFYDSVVRGASLVQGLQKALDEAIAKLPIPKVMSYQLETIANCPAGAA